MADIIKLDEDVEIESKTEEQEKSDLLDPMKALGDVLANNPAFQKLAQRANASRSAIYRRPLQKARGWDLSFGPVYGLAGTTTVITVAPRCLFRGEKIIAEDTSNTPGYGTRIMSVFVGRRVQPPGKLVPTAAFANNPAPPTAAFANNSLGSGLKLDTCDPALSIAVQVSFVESCTFDMVIFGKAVL